MNLGTLFAPGELAKGRFLLVSLLPTYVATISLLALIWAGAPGRLDFQKAWRTAADLRIGETLLILLLVTFGALLVHPMQRSILRVLEGYHWPPWICRSRCKRHIRRRRALVIPPSMTHPSERQLAADWKRRRYYPAESRIRPTLFGNVLAAAEDSAGAAYGFDAVIAWPRLYMVLGETTRRVIDDRRNQLDLAARMTVTGMVMTVVAAALLADSGWWIFLALAPAAVAVFSYMAAVAGALTFGEAMHAAFDLHRFDLLDALRMPRPADNAAERDTNAELCRLWRREVQRISAVYRHP